MSPWDRSLLALQLLALDPGGLGGMAIRARSGPVRDAFQKAAALLLPPMIRLHPSMSHEDLHGGIDLPATLSAGKAIYHRGLLDRSDSTLVLSMAERCSPLLAHLLGQELDRGHRGPVFALDEGADETEQMPAELSDRLAFHIDFDQIAMGDISEAVGRTEAATVLLRRIDIPDDLPEQLVHLCVSLGINSLRAPYFALRAAKASAAYFGRISVDPEDITLAAALVLAPRATQLPQDEESRPDPSPEENETHEPTKQQLEIPNELLLDAVKAALPQDVLSQLASGNAKTATGSGSGQKKTGNRRGRPLPARNRRAHSGTRIDLMATLRAAVPWQSVRRREQPERKGAIIRAEDLRARRYQEHSDRLLIFTVDASGSAALARLGEAKGAVELLLAEAYARRDYVSLVAFRGKEAEELLPPTRSLVQTKRRLAELPGGGGTPTAAGLTSAIGIAEIAARRGMSPTVILLTDGRSNVALDGTADRAKAADDATRLARQLQRMSIDSLVIDTANRPETTLVSLANNMGATYITLPRADAKKLSGAVTEALGN